MPTQEELLQQELSQSQPKPMGWQDVLMSLIPGYAQSRTNSYNTQMARKQQLQKELGDLMQQAIGRREKIVTAGKVEGTPQQLEQFMTTGQGLEETTAFKQQEMVDIPLYEYDEKTGEIKEMGTFKGKPGTKPIVQKKSQIQGNLPGYSFDPGTGKYYQSTPEGLQETGSIVKGSPVRQLTQAIGTKKKGLTNLSSTVGKIKELLDTIPSAEGVSGRITGYLEKGKSLLGYEPNLKLYQDYKKGILGQIVSTIGGESGSRISDQDVERMEKVLPDVTETTTERRNKWALFFKTVNDIALQYGTQELFNTQTGAISRPEISESEKQQPSELKNKYSLE